ncbi:Rhamnolipids biosynthesis 3-oxoacyl-[acyl-carrier-protein] [Cyphellophora attinorum]|uniref:Rhamnolipids biosynthesis 3-oxoacyl-[acyl-carrier-protein] n=1 Tax=Cyphellophora attinorum TaxID=1664694 RepID=A0A0N0NLK8_9EURO|nr:Rhamnolipids biosynthesis 3-oxoacyl-[acyl-carrier-protein] [Phialophora attinorum]KPI39149.1 Rhamnolipids biosynthesis 3-oxoacyl-[acyl-carrier-protein] [Phialophora attinorum]
MASTDQLHVSNLFNYKDAVCLVTGGGTGIGLMATQALAANGAKVYITGRRMEVLENAAKTHSPSSTDTSLNGSIIPIGPCDVTSKSDLESLVSQIEAKESHLTLLVAAAGISGPKGPADTTDAKELKSKLWEESVDEWNQTYNADVTSVYFSTVAFLPLLQKGYQQGLPSSVIVISSMSGVMRHSQGHFAYNAAKAATAHLSQMMSKEFAKTGVRVNSIAPGYFPSEMTMKESDERNKAEMPDEKVKDKGHEVPAGRAGRDEEMGMLVLFLGSCGYVNGEVVKIDGGVMNEVGGG